MMGVSHEGPVCLYGDDQSALANDNALESELKKNSSYLSCDLITERVAMDYYRTLHVDTHDDEAELLTKVKPFGEKRHRFVRKLLIHIYATS